MKKLFVIFSLLSFFVQSVYDVDFDTSIDSEIRKTYNLDESYLPPLPTEEPSVSYPIEQPKYEPLGKTFVVKDGTKLELVSTSYVSDKTLKGSKVSFALVDGFLTKEGQVVPAGTILKGVVTDSHPPQITGNGGLVELDINEIYFNGIKSPISTKLSKVDSKKIFLNNVKGERKYWKNYSKAMTPGKKVFTTTQTCASAMSTIPVVNLVSFVPVLVGSSVYAVNFIVAPFVAVFTKGGTMAIPTGTEIQIKVTKDSEING